LRMPHGDGKGVWVDVVVRCDERYEVLLCHDDSRTRLRLGSSAIKHFEILKSEHGSEMN
jgi:hypothetical protein